MFAPENSAFDSQIRQPGLIAYDCRLEVCATLLEAIPRDRLADDSTASPEIFEATG
jgi:hypothetical protein